MDQERLVRWFHYFAERECPGDSDLYGHLARHIAGDREILEVAAFASPGQPIPNLLFGAVQYLLLKGKGTALSAYYPGLAEQPKEMETCYPHFRAFVLSHREEVMDLLRSKLVQTNDVRRCAYLYPVFSSVYERVQRPLAMVELGCSAGLQLLWDQYSYAYGGEEVYGKWDSPVRIESEIRGRKPPFLLPASPPVVYRAGIDLHVNDMRNAEDALWLRALIWPGNPRRISMLEQAAELLKRRSDLQFVEGDGTELLPNVVRKIPQEAVPCVFHTHVANQIPEEQKHRLLHHLNEIGRERDIVHVYNNMWDRDLHADYIVGGKRSEQIMLRADGHAKWFEWLA